jgi:hypothetical protein
VQRSGRFAIAELKGGLGNQLFQYAAARALCAREARLLYFAWYRPGGGTQRRYMLDVFNLSADVEPALLGYARLCWLGLRSPALNRKAGKLWRLARCRLARIDQAGFAFAPLRSAAQGVVLDGYFQSWRYFANQEREIRANLQPRYEAVGQNAALLRRMAEENAICLHVRRGDYVANPSTAAFHGVLGLAYYHAALEELGSLALGATFYVFSDDPDWTRANLKIGGATIFVDHNSVDEPWEDLRLMAACRHFVIANSSLSWWGAWLSDHAEKKVIAPARWFSGAGLDTKDLCPPQWVRL